jgi:hypothetical protein
VQSSESWIFGGKDRSGKDSQPGWRVLHPSSHRKRCSVRGELGADLDGNMNSLEEARHDMDGINEN